MQDSTTSSEFVEWMHFLEKEEQRVRPLQHYLAQIAAEVRRSYVKYPKRVETDDFLLRFVSQKPESESHTLEERTAADKSFFFRALGMKVE